MIKTSSYSDTGGRDHNEDFVCISASGVKLCAVVADGYTTFLMEGLFLAHETTARLR